MSEETPSTEDALYVAIDRFESGLAAVSDLQNAGALRLLVRSSLHPSPVQFELRKDDDALHQVLARHGIEHSDLLDVIGDLDDCLHALLSGSSPERFAQVRSDPSRWEDGEHESREVAERKLRLTVETIDVDDLRRRFWIKETAKTPIPGRIDWEVLSKRADALSPLPGDSAAVFATIRLATEPSAAKPISLTDQLKQINITVDMEDVGYMIDSLKRLETALAQIREASDDE